jgi:hypothetical protein
MKTYGEAMYRSRNLDLGTSWSDQAHVPVALSATKFPPCAHWIGGWVGPRTGMDDVERTEKSTLPGFELRSLGRSVRSRIYTHWAIPALKTRHRHINILIIYIR